jgi:hypothetical protein
MTQSIWFVFLVSVQLALLSALPKFLHSLCGQTVCVSRCSSEKFHLDWCQSLFILLSEVPKYAERSLSPAVSISAYRDASPYINKYFLLGKLLMTSVHFVNNEKIQLHFQSYFTLCLSMLPITTQGAKNYNSVAQAVGTDPHSAIRKLFFFYSN